MLRLATIFVFAPAMAFGQNILDGRSLALSQSDLLSNSVARVFDNASAIRDRSEVILSSYQWLSLEGLTAGQSAITLKDVPFFVGYNYLNIGQWTRHQVLLATNVRVDEAVRVGLTTGIRWKPFADPGVGFTFSSSLNPGPGRLAFLVSSNMNYSDERLAMVGYMLSLEHHHLYARIRWESEYPLSLSFGYERKGALDIYISSQLSPWAFGSGFGISKHSINLMVGSQYNEWLGWVSGLTVKVAWSE